MKVIRFLLLGALFGLVAGAGRAERVPLEPDQLKAEATHVVTGVVKAVYSREAQTTLYGKGTVETHYLIEIEVATVEKGKPLQAGDLVYARSWRLKKRGEDGKQPGPSGHFVIPSGGERVRAYLAHGSYGPTGQDDKGWAVVYPNGLEPLQKPKK